MLAPVTVSRSDGVTITLSRSGDRVQALVAVPDTLTQLAFNTMVTLPAPFRPLGLISIQAPAPSLRYMAIVSGAESLNGQAGTMQLSQLDDAPFGNMTMAWLGETIAGERSLSDRLAEYVAGDARSSQPPADFLAETLTEAFALVERVCGSAAVPDAVRQRAIIETGSELFHRRQAPSGISQYADATGTPLRIARDPMNVARVILAPFLSLGFA